ncbi:MAG TPA: hypothetical protein VK950_10340 [Methylophilus sp.]|nr:hypothetical protein [Methylophilus sp.]
MSRLLPELPGQIRWCGLTRILVTSASVLAEHWPVGFQSRRQLAQAALENLEPIALQTALGSVLAQLFKTSWQHIEIYFADQHVHLMLLPAIEQSGQASALSSNEQQAFARAMLINTYGEAAVQWPFRHQDAWQSGATLLATIPALQTLTAQNLISPRKYLHLSVQPYACALWAQTRLPANGTVITAEPHTLRLLQLEKGKIMHIASLATDISDLESITAWLLRERTLSGVHASACYWLNEQNNQLMLEAGRCLAQHLAGQLKLQTLQSTRAITSLWWEALHVA